jgi:predicted enzyme related to lactoylglutathione lyase
MGKILNFHLPADDAERASAFYRKVFDWEITPFPGSETPYLLVRSGPEDEPGIEGAIVARTNILKHPAPTIEVDDIDAKMAVLAMSGGRQGQVIDIPGVGRFGYAMDSEDNVIALLQRADSPDAPK